MPEVLSLFGDISIETNDVQRSLRNTNTLVESTAKSIAELEKRAESAGNKTATQARQFDKLNQTLNNAKTQLVSTFAAFKRGDASSEELAKAFRKVETAAANVSSRIKDAEARLTDFQARAKRGAEFQESFTNRLVGASTVGGLLGGLAAGAVIAAVDTVKDLAGQIASLGVEAVKLASTISATENAMTVFTGSSRLAKAELADIENLAKNTVGLRLQDAREGTIALRGLGFEAKTTKDLLVGIAKLKLYTPGADEGSTQRVLVNLSQLKAGSPQITKDIQQMILAFPKLSQVITDTFGSIDKFKKAIQDDPDAAIRKFAEGMKGIDAPAGSFQNSLNKTADEFIKTGETFGKPILEPLMRWLDRVVEYLDRSRSKFGQWGQYVGDVIDGVNEKTNPSNPNELSIQDKLSAILFSGALGPTIRNNPGTTARIGAGVATLGTSEIPLYAFDQSFGEAQRTGETLRKQRTAITSIADLRKADDRTLTGEEQARQRELERYEKQRAERIKQLEIETIDSTYKERFNIISNALKREEMLAAANFADVGGIRDKYLKQEIAAQVEFYDRQIQLAEGDKIKTAQLTAEKNAKIRDLNTELLKNSLETAKRVQDAQKALEGFRADAVSALSGNPAAKQFYDISRAAEEAYKSTKILGEANARTAASYVRMAGAVKLSKDALDASLSAVDYRQQARQARLTPAYEMNGVPRRTEALEQSISILSRIADYQANSRAARDLFNNPNYLNNPQYETDQILQQIEDARRFGWNASSLAGEFGDLGISGKGILAQAQLARLPDVGTLARLAQQGGGNGDFARQALGTVADLNSTLAQSQEEELRRTLAKNQVIQNTAIPNALEKLRAIQSSSAPSADKDAAFLAVANELGSEITPEILKGKIGASERLAASKEADAKQLRDFITNLSSGKIKIPVDLNGQYVSKVDVKGLNATVSTDKVSPNGATQQNTANSMDNPF